MTRVKGGTVAKTRRRKVLKQAKGYFGSKHRLFKTAQEQLFHSGEYAYRDRKVNKRNFRKLWITRINAACRDNQISYSQFISGLTKAGVSINRKMLSELAIDDMNSFKALITIAKDALAGKITKPVASASENKPVKAEKTTTKAAATEVKEDYPTMTLTELKALAKAKGVAGYSTMKKADLIASLS